MKITSISLITLRKNKGQVNVVAVVKMHFRSCKNNTKKVHLARYKKACLRFTKKKEQQQLQ